jgi:hypothetical protein
LLAYNAIIDKVMDIGLHRINDNPEMNIDELFKQATGGDERSVHIIVYNDPENGYKPKSVFKNPEFIIWKQGLAHKDHKIVKVNLPKYTVTYKITLSAWYRLISQQNTFKDLYWSDMFDAEGDYFFRDLVIWGRFWEQYKDVVHLNKFEKTILRQKGDILE